MLRPGPRSVTQPGSIGGEGVRYELIAGERRWRAAALAGLATIPAVVRDVDDRTAAELALIENLQREDLNPVERADAFARLINEFGLSHQDLAERVGLDRSSVSNILRINELDSRIRGEVAAGRLSLGHAKALLMVADAEVRWALAADAIRLGWSVRALEQEARRAGGSPGSRRSQGREAALARSTVQLEAIGRTLTAQLGTRARVQAGRRKGSGRIIIDFFTLDQFDQLMRRMNVRME